YAGSAQSTQGGWFYTSRVDGNHDSDEGSVTVTQMQALRACRDAGIPVPKEIMKKGADYLRKSTAGDGGVVYSLGRGQGMPAGRSQSADGSFQGAGGWGSGPIYSTAVYCVMMQLDNNCLPVFQR